MTISINQSEHVLITGATGFIGSHLAVELDRREFKLSLVVRNKNDPLIRKIKNLGNVYETKNLFQEPFEWWLDVYKDVGTVVHMAWITTPGVYLHSLENIDCLEGSLRMAKAALRSGVKKYIGIGTCFEYDLRKSPISTSTILSPKTLYAATKVALFHTLDRMMEGSQMGFTWARIFYVHGTGEHKERLHPTIESSLRSGRDVVLNNPNAIRDYLHVEDAAKQLAELVIGYRGGPVNVCSGRGVSIREIAETIKLNLNSKGKIIFAERTAAVRETDEIIGVR